MDSDSTATYKQDMHKDFTYTLPKHLSPVTLTEHLLANPAEYKGRAPPPPPTPHLIRDALKSNRSYGLGGFEKNYLCRLELDEAGKKPLSDHSSFSCFVCFPHT